MSAKEAREYDLILFGATGFTGKLTAEHITRHLPTDLRWAVAGRNHKKLSNVVDELRQINSDRTAPGIEIAELSSHDLEILVKKTRVVISTAGPYHLYGTPVVEACAKSGTHYIDCSGETPWVYDVIQNYHETAKKNEAVLIPLCGVESSPADVVAYVLASHIRRQFSTGTGQITHSIQAFAGATSGGTNLSALTLFDSYSLRQLKKSSGPFALATSKPPERVNLLAPLSFKLFGSHDVPGLGLLSDSLCGMQDRQLVYRTWSLLDDGKYYGPKLSYSSWMRTKNRLAGFFFHYGLTLAIAALLIKPLRWLIKKLVKQPGDGPAKEAQTKHHVKIISLASADSDPSKRAECTMSFQGDMYYLTGVLMAEAAMVLIRPQPGVENWAQKLRGGVLTPATLGDQYVDGLNDAGVKINVKTIST